MRLVRTIRSMLMNRRLGLRLAAALSELRATMPSRQHLQLGGLGFAVVLAVGVGVFVWTADERGAAARLQDIEFGNARSDDAREDTSAREVAAFNPIERSQAGPHATQPDENATWRDEPRSLSLEMPVRQAEYEVATPRDQAAWLTGTIEMTTERPRFVRPASFPRSR